MKKTIMTLSTALTILFASTFAKADAAVEPVNVVGGAMNSNCGLIQVAPGNFNAGGWLAVDLSTPGGQAILATAMLAYAAGKHIWVNRVPQATEGCYGLTDYAGDVRAMTY